MAADRTRTETASGADARAGDDTPLHYWSAVALAAGIRRREISAVEVMRAHLDRIDEVNGRVTAIVSQQPASMSLELAAEADRAVARGRTNGDVLGPLHGLPTAVKDLMDVAGLPTTHGSAAYADAPPAVSDSVLAGRLRRSGAIIIGKTNTPENGLGTLTFNPVFGTTVNPWNLTRHAGGSSGGAAAAVASGMLPVADGSDSGGSLRYPAAFCNVVGLRPTPGAVPSGRPGDAWSPHAVLGPMARDSRDAALLMSAISGLEPRWPLSFVDDPGQFTPRSFSGAALDGLRFAWSADLGGVPIDPGVAAVHRAARDALVAAGATVIDAEPDFSHADESWQTIEMFEFFSSGRHELAAGASGFRDDYLRNVEQGRRTTATQLADALAWRTELYRDTAALLGGFDALIAPATPVVAPDARLEWVHEVAGHAYDRYFGWQTMANRVTSTGHPVLVTPAGFSDALPVGLQIIGRYRADARLLAIGSAFESVLGYTALRPTGLRSTTQRPTGERAPGLRSARLHS